LLLFLEILSQRPVNQGFKPLVNLSLFLFALKHLKRIRTRSTLLLISPNFMIALGTLDPLITSKSLLKHPFYVRWSRGALTLEDMNVYAKEYFHLVQAIPGIVSGIAENIQDAELKEFVLKNAEEETEHVELWKRFACACGISNEELEAYEPSAKAKQAVQLLIDAAAESSEHGIAAMYALEMELPKIAQTKKEGLLEYYGLSSQDAQAYFDEHLKEEEHLQVWRKFSMDEGNAVPAAEASLKAQHLLLNAVCDAAGLPYDC